MNMCNVQLIFIICFLALPACAYMTSDFDLGMGISSIRATSGSNTANIESTSTLDMSYNINAIKYNTAITLNCTETVDSNQGHMSYTRMSLGARIYLFGMNGQRIIFDRESEGRIFSSSPFVGFNVGLSNMSIEELGSGSGNFNATGYDAGLRVGNEIVISPNVFLIGQVFLLYSLEAGSQGSQDKFNYNGLGLLIGLKVTSY